MNSLSLAKFAQVHPAMTKSVSVIEHSPLAILKFQISNLKLLHYLLSKFALIGAPHSRSEQHFFGIHIVASMGMTRCRCLASRLLEHPCVAGLGSQIRVNS